MRQRRPTSRRLHHLRHHLSPLLLPPGQPTARAGQTGTPGVARGCDRSRQSFRSGWRVTLPPCRRLASGLCDGNVGGRMRPISPPAAAPTASGSGTWSLLLTRAGKQGASVWRPHWSQTGKRHLRPFAGMRSTQLRHGSGSGTPAGPGEKPRVRACMARFRFSLSGFAVGPDAVHVAGPSV
jgi:hypothetical protein